MKFVYMFNIINISNVFLVAVTTYKSPVVMDTVDMPS